MIKVLLFAELQEKVGQNALDLTLNKTNVSNLKSILEKDYPNLNLQKVMTAVNEEYANDEDVIQAGDTVAFIPPVSGG
ncbi:molybdopterin converting factor subunit 1 [Oceanobacillus sp. CAU 1775]